MFESHLRSDGLLNVSCPSVSVIGRSVFKPNKFVTRRLTQGELLRIFDIPMALDEALCAQQWAPSQALPFESAVSPAILASIFRHVWGYVGGVEDSALTPPSVSVAAVAPETPCIPAVDLVVEESINAVVDELGPDPLCVDIWADDAHPEPQDEWSDDDDSLALSSVASVPDKPIIISSSTEDWEQDQWDEESDDDSLMPRRR